jgi:hypothetical protein
MIEAVIGGLIGASFGALATVAVHKSNMHQRHDLRLRRVFGSIRCPKCKAFIHGIHPVFRFCEGPEQGLFRLRRSTPPRRVLYVRLYLEGAREAMRHRRRRFQRARKQQRVELERAGASAWEIAKLGVVNIKQAVWVLKNTNKDGNIYFLGLVSNFALKPGESMMFVREGDGWSPWRGVQQRRWKRVDR